MLRSVSDGVKRGHPDLSDLADELYDSVYGPDAIPEVVRDNWADVNVRTFWSLKVSVAQKLAFIETYLGEKAAAEDSGASVDNGEG